HDPIEISMFTGAYDVPGWNEAQGVFVHADNPLKQLTLKQLDGIFGTLRDGGWVGTTWHTEYPYSRGADENIRTWGQLGLTGEWKDKPIHPGGQNLRGHPTLPFFDVIVRGSDQF